MTGTKWNWMDALTGSCQMIFGVVLCLCPVPVFATTPKTEQTWDRETAEFDQLPEAGVPAYLESLRKQGRFAQLYHLTQAETRHTCQAINWYARWLPEKDVVAFCKSFPLGSREWQAAFWALADHRRDGVVGYVKEASLSPSALVRAQCYQVCLRGGWDDLVGLAQIDQNDKTQTSEYLGPTLGGHAKRYLTLLPAFQAMKKQ